MLGKRKYGNELNTYLKWSAFSGRVNTCTTYCKFHQRSVEDHNGEQCPCQRKRLTTATHVPHEAMHRLLPLTPPTFGVQSCRVDHGNAAAASGGGGAAAGVQPSPFL